MGDEKRGEEEETDPPRIGGPGPLSMMRSWYQGGNCAQPCVNLLLTCTEKGAVPMARVSLQSLSLGLGGVRLEPGEMRNRVFLLGRSRGKCEHISGYCAGSRSPHQTPRTPHSKCYQLQRRESRKREEPTERG